MADNSRGGTSNPNPCGPTPPNDSSLAVQTNANLQNFDRNPPVFNESPATRKSYSWNKGETGNAR